MDQINPDLSSPTYGGYLKALRQARGFDDLKDFAKAVYGEVEKPAPHTQYSNLSNWEADRYRPQGAMLGRLAKALNVSQHSINPKQFKPSWMNRLAIMKPLGPDTEDGYREEGGVPFVPNAMLDSLPEEIRPGFGESYASYVKRMRLLRGFASANALSARLGGSHAVVGRIENGLSLPSEETTLRLAEVLDVPYALMDKSLFERLQEQGDAATETYGDYLARLRRAAGYRQQNDIIKVWVERYGVTLSAAQQAFSKWEGGRGLPNRTGQERLAQIFGISAKTLDPKRFVPGRLLPPTLKIAEPEIEAPAPSEEIDVEAVTSAPEMLNNGMDIETSDVQWGKENKAAPPSLKQEFGSQPQFLKQHVDVFGLSKTDDPNYVRIRFDATLPRATAGRLIKKLVKLTTDDLLGGEEE